MRRTRLNGFPTEVPENIRRRFEAADIYDSSCSPEARVYFIDADCGYFLKRGAHKTLEREVKLTHYFNLIGLGARVLSYTTDRYDWMLTERVMGEDCTHRTYLEDPMRLSALLGERLRELHSTPYELCPIKNRTEEYLKTVLENYRTGNYDTSQFPDSFGYRSADEAYAALKDGMAGLRSDVLIHGDFCLPNVMLDNWKPTGYIDVGNGGVGDRHIDLFWGTWTLWFNLKTDKYTARFLDAYGRDKIDPELIRTVAAAEVFG